MLAPLGINALEDASERPNVARFVELSAFFDAWRCAEALVQVVERHNLTAFLGGRQGRCLRP